MAFVVKEVKRYTHPDEPEFWVEMRLPPGSGTLRGVSGADGEITAGLDLLGRVITGWSDPRPVSQDAIDDLDVATFKWLSGVVTDSLGKRTEEEKKDSNSPPSARTSATEASRTS